MADDNSLAAVLIESVDALQLVPPPPVPSFEGKADSVVCRVVIPVCNLLSVGSV